MTKATNDIVAFTNGMVKALNWLKDDSGAYNAVRLAARADSLRKRGRNLDIDTQAALVAALDRALNYDDANSVCLVLNAMPASAKTKRALAWVMSFDVVKARFCKKQGKYVAKMVKQEERGETIPTHLDAPYWEFEKEPKAPVAYTDKRAAKALDNVVTQVLAEGADVSDDMIELASMIKEKLAANATEAF